MNDVVIYPESVQVKSISVTRGFIDLLLRVNAEESDHRISGLSSPSRFQPALRGNRQHTWELPFIFLAIDLWSGQ